MTRPNAPSIAVELEVVKASLSGIVQEMQNSLFRTGFSTIVRESQDASCALMNAEGEVVAQHVVLPLHIGAFPACCGAVLEEFGGDIAEGDAFLINHPYEGGSPHAPDMCVLTPVFVDGALFGFCGSIAHKSDIGGPVPGSCSGQAREIFNEGLHLPAVRYQRAASSATSISSASSPPTAARPSWCWATSAASSAPTGSASGGCIELLAKYGKDKVAGLLRPPVRTRRSDDARGRRRMGGRPLRGRALRRRRRRRSRTSRCASTWSSRRRATSIHFDFSGSADQTKGPANVRPPLVQAACAYCLISLIDPHMYVSSGLLRAFTINAREGSVLNPRFPAPVNTYNPTVHALVDAVYDALVQHRAGQGRAPTAAAAARSSSAAARTYTGKGYVQYEIIGGGAGARATKDGASGTSSQPEQRQDRAGRDHRERVPDARCCASS